MNIEQLFVLAGGVEFLSMDTIPSQAKTKFLHTDSDVVITHRNTRSRSKVVDKNAADLLKNFATPQSWAEAILSHALRTNQDPQQLADEAFPLLLEMKEEGFLVPGNGQGSDDNKSFLQIADAFQNYIVKEVCQVLEDNAVYRVEDNQGVSYALKLFRPTKDHSAPTTWQNETAILQTLDGRVNPVLIAHGLQDDVFYLITEWCKGTNSLHHAAKFRNLSIHQNALAILDLCIAILTAYEHVHKQGVLHGDVHASNVLVGENGVVKIIDYGFSSVAGSGKRMSRGGIGFYYEPEMAEAILQKKALPPVTEKSEQYCLAVLLHRLITGQHYLDFSFEPDQAYQQILTEPPLSFSHFGIDFPSSIDKTFATALAKNPADRYSSIKEFRQALQNARAGIKNSRLFFISGKGGAAEKFPQFLVQKYGWDSEAIKKGLALPPTCSVNYGAAGIAYLFYRMAGAEEDSNLLALADVWANRAAAYAEDYTKSFYTRDQEISENTVGRRSLYHSPTGVHLVQTLVDAGRGDRYALQKSISAYLSATKVSCKNIDVTLGTAGLLIGSSLLLDELTWFPQIDTTVLKNRTGKLMDELWETIDSYSTLDQPNEVNYFGVAHGWAGLLYATLKWCKASQTILPKSFHDRLQALESIAIKTNDFLRWPVSTNNASSWTGWCHGSAGHVLFWSLCHQYFKEEKYLLLAQQCGNHLLSDRQNVAQLCCGLAGQAYAFNRLYQLTGDRFYEQKIELVKDRILENLAAPVLRSNSLYKGDVGIAVLLCELRQPALARMPLFE